MYILYKDDNRASRIRIKYIQAYRDQRLEEMDKYKQYSKREYAEITFFILKRVF